MFKGEHVKEKHVTVMRGPEVRISADRPFTVYADGDPIGELPVTIRAVPGAIRVLLPRTTLLFAKVAAGAGPRAPSRAARAAAARRCRASC